MSAIIYYTICETINRIISKSFAYVYINIVNYKSERSFQGT